MQALRKTDAELPKPLMLVGIALNGVLKKRLYQHSFSITWRSVPTAIGFANVLTNSEVILSVRDMVSLGRGELQERKERELSCNLPVIATAAYLKGVVYTMAACEGACYDCFLGFDGGSDEELRLPSEYHGWSGPTCD